MNEKPTVIGIPGLGGHPSAFGLYGPLFPEYDLRYIELVNRDKAFDDAAAIIRASENVALLCSCYAVQLGLKLAEAFPDKVTRLVLIEPFFMQFHWWRWPLFPIGYFLLGAARLTDLVGLRRRRFSYQPDYVALAKYPIFVQPLFDMWWQNLTDYFDKCVDALTFRLPARVTVPTLILYSPYGFTRDKKVRAKVRGIFVNSEVVEMDDGTHNIITTMSESAAQAIHNWLRSSK